MRRNKKKKFRNFSVLVWIVLFSWFCQKCYAQEPFFARTLTGYIQSNIESRGNGDIAQAAEISNPAGVFGDSNGDVYLAESTFIRKIDFNSQIISIFAGGGTSNDDDVPATEAYLENPHGIVGDTQGNIYFTDAVQCCVRRINAIIHVETILGTCYLCGITSGAYPMIGLTNSLSAPRGLAYREETHTLYIADTGNHVIKMLYLSNYSVTVVMGAESTSAGSDFNISPLLIGLNGPHGVTVLNNGELYVADTDNHRIIHVSETGEASVFIGTSEGDIIDEYLTRPSSVCVDGNSNIFICSLENMNLRQVVYNKTAATTVILGANRYVIAHGLLADEGGIGSVPSCHVNIDGVMLMTDNSANVVWKFELVTGSTYRVLSVVGYVSGVVLPASAARLKDISYVWGDSTGKLYLSSSWYNQVHVVEEAASQEPTIRVFAGTRIPDFYADDIQASLATLYYPKGITGDSNGAVYIGEAYGHRIRKVLGGVITTVAGNGGMPNSRADPASIDYQSATSTSIYGPLALAMDPDGTRLFFSNYFSSIAYVDLNTNLLKHVSGGYSTTDHQDGSASEALFASIQSLFFDLTGSLYIADGGRVRVMHDDVVSTFAGAGQEIGNDLRANVSSLETLVAICGIRHSNIYFNEMETFTIREVQLDSNILRTFIGQRFLSPSAIPEDNVYVSNSTAAGNMVACHYNSFSDTFYVSEVPIIYHTEETPARVRRISVAASPTSQPSSQPSCIPSNQPSCSPSVRPTSQPSAQPSDEPEGQPSSQPTGLPSGQPSHQPISSPTVLPSGQPSSQPTNEPSSHPSGIPTTQPSTLPSGQPSGQPSIQPTRQPSGQPSAWPTLQPSAQPNNQPTCQPSSQPSNRPSSLPSDQPSGQPSFRPSGQPTRKPTNRPSDQPSGQPSSEPSSQPSSQPSNQPTIQPSCQPSGKPSPHPSSQPTCQPSCQPSVHPSGQPSFQPSSQPSHQPTRQPSCQPSGCPSAHPTAQPSGQPTNQPSGQPSTQPTGQPSCQPSRQPITRPSGQPSIQPTHQPSCQPSGCPSAHPTAQPSDQPTDQPSGQPSSQPAGYPSGQPSIQPTVQPSWQPSGQPITRPSSQPSGQPSIQPTRQPSSQPSGCPSSQPSDQPTNQPSGQPSNKPTGQPSSQPSNQPSMQPTIQPSCQPSIQPIMRPTAQPSIKPTSQPSNPPSSQPTRQPSTVPSSQPSDQPTIQPRSHPSGLPSSHPSDQPSGQPTRQPSGQPSGCPSAHPSVQSSGQPTQQPRNEPTGQPSSQPSNQPSSQPSDQPSGQPSLGPSGQSTGQPSCRPSSKPSSQPSSQPTKEATALPSGQSSCRPSIKPSSQPSKEPTFQPCSQSSNHPSRQPSMRPSVPPTSQPSAQPSFKPSLQPTCRASSSPSSQPSGFSSNKPSFQPSVKPTCQPSAQPTVLPFTHPSNQPCVTTLRPTFSLFAPQMPSSSNNSTSDTNASLALAVLSSLTTGQVDLSLVTDSVRVVSQTVSLGPSQGSGGSIINVQVPLSAAEVALQQSGQSITAVPTISLNILSTSTSNSTSPGSGGNGNSTVYVAVLLLDSSLWSTSSQGNSSGSNNKPQAGQLQTSIVAISVVNNNGNASSPSSFNATYVDIGFVGDALPRFNASPPINFTITCPPRYVVTKSHTCNDTGYVETVQCKGIAGKYHGTCPVLAQTCAALDLTSLTLASSNVCQTIKVNTTVNGVLASGIVCRCGLGGAGFTEGTGSVAAGVVLGLVAGDLSKTFQASTAFGDGSAASKAAVVLSLFCGIWGCAAFLVLLVGYGRWLRVVVVNDSSRQEIFTNREIGDGRVGLADRISEEESVKKVDGVVLNKSTVNSSHHVLRQYVDILFPTVFQSRSFLEGVGSELWHKHQFLNFFLRLHHSLHPVLDVVKMVTLQGFLLFLLALLYDLNYPSDDGSCVQHMTASDCLQRKFIFDPAQSYCRWQIMAYAVVDDDSVYYECVYAEPSFSFTTAMYVSMLISLATCVFMDPLEYLVSLLGAPTLVGASAAVGPDNAATPATPAAADDDGDVAHRDVEIAGDQGHNVRMASCSRLLSPKESRPQATQSAYYRHLPQAVYQTKAYYFRESAIDRQGVADGSILSIDALEEVVRLSRTDLLLQGEAASSLLSQFDLAWCLDSATGQFLSMDNGTEVFRMQEVIATELDDVSQQAEVLDAELKLQETAAEVGFEIMVQFVQDLLGGTKSAAARIFALKMELEYEKVLRVRHWVKVCIVLFLVGLNGFFFYFTLLRAISKGIVWQRSYLLAWLLQVVLDVCLFETLQCVWFHYFLPSLAKDEVRRAKQVVEEVVALTVSQQSAHQRALDNFFKKDGKPILPPPIDTHKAVCHEETEGGMLLSSSKSQLDASLYLFVSSRLSERHFNLLVSQMVRSYTSVLPVAAMSKRWHSIYRNHLKKLGGRTEGGSSRLDANQEYRKNGSSFYRLWHFPQRVFIYLVVQLLTHAPLQVQSVVIRVSEPVAFSGVIFLFLLLRRNIVFLAVAVVLIALLCLFALFDFAYGAIKRKNKVVDSVDHGGREDAERNRTPLPTPSPSPLAAANVPTAPDGSRVMIIDIHGESRSVEGNSDRIKELTYDASERIDKVSNRSGDSRRGDSRRSIYPPGILDPDSDDSLFDSFSMSESDLSSV